MPAVTLQFSLADDPRTLLIDWYKDVCKVASSLAAHLNLAGALSLVASDATWQTFPGNLTNYADMIANGDPPNYRARPTLTRPADHVDNAQRYCPRAQPLQATYKLARAW